MSTLTVLDPPASEQVVTPTTTVSPSSEQTLAPSPSEVPPSESLPINEVDNTLPRFESSQNIPTHPLPVRNARHYWEPIVLLVGGQLFKVPRYHMEKGSSSEEFLGRLDSSGSSSHFDGSSDERPLALDVDDDITATEFEGFLDLLYPSDIPPDLSSKTQEEWIAILKISTKWGFLQIRELAIQKLTPMNMTVFKRIELAREYSVAQWLRSGYFDLVKQLETLTMENVESIGYPSSIRIFRIREQMIKKYGSVDSSSFSGYSYTIPQFSTNHWNNAEIHKAIEEEFIGELVEADERDVVPERADNFDTSCPVTYDPPDSPEPEDANETLIISQKLEKAIQLVREISEIQRGDLGEKEKEELIKKLQRKGERYWGAYSAFNHPSSIDVSLLQPSRATDAIEERILYLLNPSAQNIRTLQVTLPKKAKGAALRNTLSIILTSRNLSSAYDRGNLRIMNIFLPGRL